MKEVRAEGTSYFYIASGNALAAARASLGTFEVPSYVEGRLDTAEDFRLVAVRNPLRRDKFLPYLLFWSQPLPLAELDQRVEAGTYGDADFASSIKTSYQVTLCGNCGRRWHTLVAPAGDPYLGAPGLMERKLAAASVLTCPSCNSSLRQLVVKIFEELSPLNPRE